MTKKLKRFILVISLTLGVLVLTWYLLGRALVYHHPIESRNILLEGWMVQTVINEAPEYLTNPEIDSIIIIKMKDPNPLPDLKDMEGIQYLDKTKNTFGLYSNGILGFELPKRDKPYTVSFKMRGTADQKYPAHYAVFYQDSLLVHGFAAQEFAEYNFVLQPNQMKTKGYFLVCFDNDAWTPETDRNLYISDLAIGSLPMKNMKTELFRVPQSGKNKRNVFVSLHTEKLYINDIGVDTSKIKDVWIESVQLNHSIAYAKGAGEYFSNSQIQDINLITAEKHSRRSYLNFRSCLKADVKIGCLGLPAYIKNPLRKEIDERFSLGYTWLYWLIKNTI